MSERPNQGPCPVCSDGDKRATRVYGNLAGHMRVHGMLKQDYAIPGNPSMRLITLHLPEPMLERLDGTVLDGWALNRSDAIRHAIAAWLRGWTR